MPTKTAPQTPNFTVDYAANYTDAVHKATEQYFAIVNQAQNAVVETVAKVTAQVGEYTNAVAGQLPEVPAVEVPGPTVHEVNALTFEFAEQALANQKAFAGRVIKAAQV